MAKKRCPNCGRRVTPEASACPQCSHCFEDRRLIGKEDDELLVVDETVVVEGANEEVAVAEGDLPETEETAAIQESEQIDGIADADSTDVVTVNSCGDPQESEQKPDTQEVPRRGRLRLVMYSVTVFVVITAVLLYLLAFREDRSDENSGSETTQNSTLPTVGDVAEDQVDCSWVKEYLGIKWVDEDSVGKKDVAAQGGFLLHIHEVTKDHVIFDLFSYVDGNAASAKDITAKTVGDSISFAFEDDGFGHSGNGNLHFRDGAIDVDVIVNDNIPLPEGVHSLAMNEAMVPQVLPLSPGIDVSEFVHIDDVKATLKETAETVVEDEMKTYRFGAVTVKTDAQGAVIASEIDFSDENTRLAYCYECIDGTMSYDTVKQYFGKANEDYKESPTDILVLAYQFENGHKVRFVFDGQGSALLKMKVEYTA